MELSKNVQPVPPGSYLKRADLEFIFGIEDHVHLHLNRPSDQLSRRTPCRILVHEMSAAAAHCSSQRHGHVRRTSPAKLAVREPVA
jgi:hypothetical protein